MNPHANRLAWLLATLFGWGWTWRHLAIEWRTNEQYEYAYGVPFLFAYLVWACWPGPMAPGTRRTSVAIAVLGWFSFVLGELLRWHDPIWRFTAALLAAGATLITIAAFLRIGGYPLLRRQAFPLIFAWTAVPWPLPLELALTQNLLRFVTALTVSMLGLAGIPTLQHGNAIELSNGVLGIDDACSGIRSLQAALMASLFLGQYFRLRPWPRLSLVLGGVLVSFALNCARVLALAVIFHRSGAAVATRYHDLAGTVATAATFGGLFLIAVFLREPRPSFPAGEAVSEQAPGCDGVFTCGAFALVPMIVWAWFSTVAAPAPVGSERPQWTLDTAALPSTWHVEATEPRPGERAGLRFSNWQGYRLQAPEGWNAQVIHLRWNRGESMPSLAFYHTPALCMPWVGWTQVGQPKKLNLSLHTGPVPCVAYRFMQDRVGVLVLQSLSSGGENGYHILDPNHLESRWRRLLTLWRAPLRQVNEELLIYVPALGNEDAELQVAAEAMDALLAKQQQ